SDAEYPSRRDHLSPPVASGASLGPGARLGAGAMTNVTLLRFSYRNFLFAPARRLLKGDFHVITQIVAALGLSWIAASAAPKKVLEDAPAAKDFTENLERIVETSRASPKAAGPAVEGGVPVLIVRGPLLRIV